ncbi:hypothetical protein J6590_021323 [Homalodisca vitripennis]|nr:hypothetical protein J6590_021323 [Homalodisca vitripennis]
MTRLSSLESCLTVTLHFVIMLLTPHSALDRLRGLYRFRPPLPVCDKLQIVQQPVLLVFYYCYTTYGKSTSAGDIDRNGKWQNAVIRYVSNSVFLVTCLFPGCGQHVPNGSCVSNFD